MKNNKPYIIVVDDSKTVQMVIQTGYKNDFHIEACSLPSEARELLKKPQKMSILFFSI